MKAEQQDRDLFSTVRAALEWGQSLPATPKIIITVVVALVALFAVYLLWQQPPAPKATSVGAGEELAKPPSAPSNTNTANNGGDVGAMVAGQGNQVSAPKIEQHVTGTGASAQAGSAAQYGPNNGIVAGNYYAAPATPQEREQQVERLKAELSDLADFPNKASGINPDTMLEGMSSSPLPLRLDAILERYHKQTIVAVPGIGERIFAFRRSYYEFSQAERNLEANAITNIGGRVVGRMRPAWEIYLRYFLLRSSGHSVADVKQGGDFTNYGITWEDAERVYGELSKEPTVGPVMRQSVARLVQLQTEAGEISAAVQAAGF